MVGKIAIVGWLAVIGAGLWFTVTTVIPSLPDVSRYLRMRRM